MDKKWYKDIRPNWGIYSSKYHYNCYKAIVHLDDTLTLRDTRDNIYDYLHKDLLNHAYAPLSALELAIYKAEGIISE